MIIRQAAPRKNGLQRPFNNYQIFGWGLFVVEGVITLLAFLPPLESSQRFTFGFLILTLLCLTLLGAFISSLIDPTDPTISAEHKARENGEEFETDLKHYCSICDSHVMPRTKHCGQCNRCVNTFDHHCQWLNNCVGERNYRVFATTITCLFLHSSIKLGLGASVLHKYYSKKHEFVRNADEYFGEGSSVGFIHIFVIMSCVVNLFFWLMMGQLIFLHVWLHSNKMTTYEYIVKKREAKALKKAQEGGEVANPTKKSKVIKKLDEEAQIGSTIQQATSIDNTVMKLIRARSALTSDHSQFLGSHDMTTNNQEFGKHRLVEKGSDTLDHFGTCVTSINTHTNAKKFVPENKSPIAILHETSMSIDDSANDDLGTNVPNLPNGRPGNLISLKNFKSDGSIGSCPIPKQNIEEEMPGGTFQTEVNQSHHHNELEGEDDENDQEPNQDQIDHIELPELECDMSIEDKSQETSKIYRLMETVRENVLFKNPLNKFFFAGSGIDIDGSNEQAHLVHSPENKLKHFLPPLNIGGSARGRNIRSMGITSPHELKMLKSEVYYVNSPHARDPMLSPQNLLPNSCRINLDRRPEQGMYYNVATERKMHHVEGGRWSERDNIPDDQSISRSGSGLSREIVPKTRNPFFKNSQDIQDNEN